MKSLLPSLWGSETRDPINRFRREIEDMFREFDRRMPMLSDSGPALTMPAIDVCETGDAIEISAELPGVSEKDVSITLDRQRLTIAGEKKSEQERKDKDWQMVERSYGSFRRMIPLPFEPEENAVEARVEKGVLHVTVKKPSTSKQTQRQIPIRNDEASTKPSAMGPAGAGSEVGPE